MDLFESAADINIRPLAEKLRPKHIADVIGQDHILGSTKPIGQLLRAGRLLNLIVTGPPGTGKTSFARALAQTAKATFMAINAVDAGVKDLKAAGEEGKSRLLQRGEKTLLFVDEIHRFNKSQQDVLLPFIERGELYLVGATTEHPSYELNRALISRCQVIQFKRLEKESFYQLFARVETFEKLKKENLIDENAFETLIQLADGDGRRFLNLLESIVELYKINPSNFPMNVDTLEELMSHKIIAYDKASDQHYDSISAFIKSVRGSDADAALYYMARMLAGGEDPVYIARRLVILASEDIGNAEPRGLPLAIAGLQAVEAIGLPEAAINLAQVVTFLASAPKSNRSYMAWNKAKQFIETTGSADLPEALKSSNKGSGEYVYPHDYEKAYVTQNYWPSAIKPQKFYEPSSRGQEKLIGEYLKWLKSNS
ncbi:MAG: replication-associated recombination protein A [Bdellovibrionaceae bacterium]|nr:replication-associated recombination protein A [Bdellovibrio sp.]